MRKLHFSLAVPLLLFLLVPPQIATAQRKPRARDLGIPFEGRQIIYLATQGKEYNCGIKLKGR
jgi:hypothetical protein